MNRKAKALEFMEIGYNISITGRHLAVTDSMKDYAMEKVAKLERFTDRIIDVNIIMDVQREMHRVEIILKVGHTKITSQAMTTDMYASIDKAVDKIEAQLRRYKEKLQNHHAKGSVAIDMNVNIIPRPAREAEEEEWEENNANQTEHFPVHEIVQQDTIPLKVLNQEEALMKMELSGDNFLLYKAEEDQKLKLIYRRKDGNYGLIEPLT